MSSPVRDTAPPRGAAAAVESFAYDNEIVRRFAVACMVWGIVAFLVGLLTGLATFLTTSRRGHSGRCRYGSMSRSSKIRTMCAFTSA